MGRSANCYDNAAMGRFLHTLKIELVHRERYAASGGVRQRQAASGSVRHF